MRPLPQPRLYRRQRGERGPFRPRVARKLGEHSVARYPLASGNRDEWRPAMSPRGDVVACIALPSSPVRADHERRIATTARLQEERPKLPRLFWIAIERVRGKS
jgi:hypothetical protein